MLTLHSLTLDHVAGVDHAHLDLPDNGVVVVHGPNEMGKTTLLTAFGLLLSEVGVNSKAAKVKALKSATEDVATTVSADMTVAGHRLTVLKSFNKGSGRCELTVTSPRRENLTGRQAAERFAELLAEGVDSSLIDALTIEQGASLDILAATGIPSLEQALGGDSPADTEASGGGAGAGTGTADGAGALIGRITDEYLKYFTRTGKTTGELQKAEKALAAAKDAEDAAEARYTQAQSLIAELERLTAEKAALAKQEPVAAEAAVEAEKTLAEGRAAVAELDELRKTVVAAAGVRDLADQRARARADRVSALADAEKTVADLTVEVQEAEKAAEQETQTTGDLQKKLSGARRRSRVATAWAARVEALSRRQGAETRVKELADRIARATGISDEVRELKKSVDDNPVTDKVLASLRAADAALRQAVTVRDAVATTVEVAGPADGAVTVDEESRDLVDGVTTVHVTGRQKIGLGDWTVTVTPAREVSEVSEDVTRAGAELDRLLAAAGTEDLAAAEDAAAARQVAVEKHREAVLRLAQITGSDTVDDLRTQYDRVSAEVEALTTRADEALEQIRAEDPGGAVELPGVSGSDSDDGTTATVTELTDAAAAAGREAERIQEDITRVTRAGAAVRLEGRKAELERVTAGHDRLAAALAADREERDDAALETAVTEAVTALAEAQADLAEVEERTGDIDLETITSLAEGAASRVRRLRERAEEAGHSVARVTGALGEHAGVAEDVANARTVLKRAMREHERVSSQAEAAALLYREVQEALARARRRYEAPLRATVERLARTLYGSQVDFEFSDDLGPSRRTLDNVTLDTDQLSGGAREQLSVLTRLAVADLVGGGDAVPVIIDDALGFSDRGRIDRMNVVLDRLGRDHQIIVLTCDLDRFDGIAGATLVPMQQVLAG
jgi:energy-coupling factor transporter ATP-binding protein EcfA2